ncbi:MAG: GtrA family protein [Acholeplasmataceae bacterium]|jgi:putative flippase GtrA|nr:GtrA family protein [Acholeplasmataceae bacterium]
MNKEDINLKQDTHDNMMQMIKFTLFSISAGVIQLLSFTLFFEIVKLIYWPSYLIALTLSVLWNFTLNRKFTFKSANNIPIAMTKVAFFYAIFTPLSTWWGDALTKINWNEYLVLGLTMVSNLILEFLYTKYFVYRNSINTAIKR